MHVNVKDELLNHLKLYGIELFHDEEYWMWAEDLLEKNLEQSIMNEYIMMLEFMQDSFEDKLYFYDLVSSYTTLTKVAHSMKTSAIMESCLAVLEEIEHTGNILDIGCNSGYLTSFYAKTFPNSNITGVDVSVPSVKLARKYGEHLENLDFHNDLNQFPHSKFDIIIDTQCFSDISIENLTILLKTIHKVLKNQGTIISISAIRHLEECKLFLETFKKHNLFLNKLEPLVFTSFGGKRIYTKLIFGKIDVSFHPDTELYFKKCLDLVNK